MRVSGASSGLTLGCPAAVDCEKHPKMDEKKPGLQPGPFAV